MDITNTTVNLSIVNDEAQLQTIALARQERIQARRQRLDGKKLSKTSSNGIKKR